MRNVLSLMAALFAVLPLRAEAPREVFAVPPVVAAAFRSGGLAAFDPFDPWLSEKAKSAQFLTPAITGAEANQLPPGVCYDVLPAWTARGFKPHEGTRVLYHPDTQLLFARIAPEDDAQVRAFCEWPPAMWMSGAYSDSGTVKQVQLRITTYSVPAAGPGDWKFRPATVQEFLSLPSEARQILQRQSFIIRGGQRSKVTNITTAPRTRDATLTGQVVEAEVTVAEDGSTVDINLAPETQVRLANGSSVILRSYYQHLIEWGNTWIIEAGTLPGNPPQRVFQVWEVLRAHSGVHDDPAFVARWLEGRDQTGATSRVLTLMDDPVDYSMAPADPFATPVGSLPRERLVKEDEEDSILLPPPYLPVPGLFGDVPMQDVSSMLESVTKAPPGSLHAWRARGSPLLYTYGTPEGMAAVSRWLETKKYIEGVSTGLAEATFTAIPSRRVLWRGSVPIRGGQRCKISVDATPPAENSSDEPPPPMAEVELEASHLERASGDPFGAPLPYWQLLAAASLGAPFVDTPLKMVAEESGTAHGVTLSRAIGRSAGEAVVLTIHLREVNVQSPWWQAEPRHDWWWQRQVEMRTK
jgi:hypothetical protein